MNLRNTRPVVTLFAMLCAGAGMFAASAQAPADPSRSSGPPQEAPQRDTAQRDTPTCFVVKFRVKPGRNAAFEQAFREMQASVREHEPGNIYYDFFRVDQDPQTYVIIERYKDAAAIREHGRAAHTRKLMTALKEMLDGPPDALRLDLVSAKN